MTNSFDEIYRKLNKDDLFQIALYPEDYQKEAVCTATKIINEKRWISEFNECLEEVNKKHELNQINYELEVQEKAEYYKNVVEFKNQDNSFQIRIPDIPKFEGALKEKKIDFFREDKNIGVQLDSYPTQTYFFKNEDIEIVDQITRELELVTSPYADIKPFFRFELKVVIIVIVLTFLLILFFK